MTPEEQRAADAHNAAQRAQQESDAVAGDPNATQADKDAAAARAREARAGSAAARAVANRAELAALTAEVAAMQGEAHEMEERVHGIKLNTKLDWDGYIEQDQYQFFHNAYGLKVIGGETKFNYLFNWSIVGGHKWEGCCSGKFTYINPYERKRVLGMSIAMITPLKKDIVMGAKWDESGGWKIETHNGVKVVLGPDECTKHPSKGSKIGRKTVVALHEKEDVKFKQTEIATQTTDVLDLTTQLDALTAEITKAQEKIDNLDRTLGEWTFKSKSYSLEGQYLYFTAGGDAKFEGNGAKLTLGAGEAKLEKGTSITISDAGVSISGVTKIL